MRFLFRWGGNLTGYDHLAFFFTVTFWCLYGCAVSSGGRVSNDVLYIKEQTADLHQSLVSALVEQISKSPMQYFPWKGDYKLAFDIMRLNFWHDSERRTFGVAEIGVQLILLSERRALFEQNPPLIVSIRKSTPGGKEPMAPLCQDAAAKIAQLLKDYLAQGHGGTP